MSNQQKAIIYFGYPSIRHIVLFMTKAGLCIYCCNVGDHSSLLKTMGSNIHFLPFSS